MNTKLARLLETLESNDIDARREATHAIGKMGEGAAEAADRLFQLIVSNRGARGNFPAHVFGKLGPAAGFYARRLGEQLKCDEVIYGDPVALALENLGSMAEPAYEFVLQALERRHTDSYWPWRNLIQILKNIDPEKRREPARVHAALVAALTQVARTTDSPKDAAWAIADRGRYVLPAVVECLPVNPYVFMRVICYMGPEAVDALPVVIDAVNRSIERYYSIPALGSLGRYTPDVEMLLIKLLDDDKLDDGDVLSALEVVGVFGPTAKALVPQIIRWVDDESYQYRRIAVETVGKMGPVARAAIPSLTACLRHSGDKELQQYAAKALLRLAPESNSSTREIARLAKEWHPQFLQIHDDNSRPKKVRKIADIAEYVRQLHSKKTCYSSDFGMRAIDAIEAIGPRAAEAVPDLANHLTCRYDCAVRAMDALASIGTESIPEILRHVEHPQEIVTVRVLWLCGRIGAKGPRFNHLLRWALRHESALINWFAAWNAAILGPGGASLRNDVELLTAHDDGDVARMATEALQRIDGLSIATLCLP